LIAAMHEAEDIINSMPAYQPLGDVVDAVEERIYAVRDANRTNSVKPLHQLAAEAASHAKLAKSTGLVDGLRFGLRTMDTMFGPLMRQNVVGIAAPSGAGKTAMALQIILSNIDPIEEGGEPRSHLFIEQEMSGLDVAMRVIARMGGPNVQAQLTGRFNEGQLDRIDAAAEDTKLIPVWIDAGGQLTMRQIRAKVKAAKRRYNIRSAWIDHLQLIRAVGKMTTLDAIRDASVQAKDIAKENDITLGILAQLTRGAQKEMRHWRFSDQAIYGGDEFKQACDVLVGVANPSQFLIDREPAYEIRGQEHLAKVQMDIDSWRSGMEVGTLKLRSSSRVGWKRIGWDGDAQTFNDP
jgi:replicative DNA helicase